MKTQIIRRFDKRGRVIIPLGISKLLEINGKCEVIICRCKEEGKLVVRKMDNLQGWEIITVSTIDCQRRLAIPSEIRQGTECVELYFKNGSSILKDAP